MYQHEIDGKAKRLKLWVRRKRGNRLLICSGCGRKIAEPADVTEREVRDLPCFEYLTTVVIELYRVRCPDCVRGGDKGCHFRRSRTEPMEPPFDVVEEPIMSRPAAVRGGGLDKELGKDAGKYSTSDSKLTGDQLSFRGELLTAPIARTPVDGAERDSICVTSRQGRHHDERHCLRQGRAA